MRIANRAYENVAENTYIGSILKIKLKWGKLGKD
jgi:hypothetical protein